MPRQQATKTLPLTVNPASGDFALSLAGGWRVNQPYCKGGLAIDFSTMRAWTAGHAQDDPSTVRGYNLPAMGSGTNTANWPQVSQTRSYGAVPTPPGWNSGNGQHFYTVGLMWRDGLLWTNSRAFYASVGSYPDTVIRKYDVSGPTLVLNSTVTLSGYPLQTYGGGFIKGSPDALVGNGGYESGQDSRCGPCWCKIDGTVINTFGRFDDAKANREKRDSDYSCGASTWFVPPDGAVGYWICGRIWGGGLYIRGKTCFWVDLGTGLLQYSNQTDTMGKTSRSYLYRYAAGDHFSSEWAYFPTPGDNTVQGCEVSPDGSKVYLLVRNAWSANGFDPSPLLCCYSVG